MTLEVEIPGRKIKTHSDEKLLTAGVIGNYLGVSSTTVIIAADNAAIDRQSVVGSLHKPNGKGRVTHTAYYVGDIPRIIQGIASLNPYKNSKSKPEYLMKVSRDSSNGNFDFTNKKGMRVIYTRD